MLIGFPILYPYVLASFSYSWYLFILLFIVFLLHSMCIYHELLIYSYVRLLSYFLDISCCLWFWFIFSKHTTMIYMYWVCNMFSFHDSYAWKTYILHINFVSYHGFHIYLVCIFNCPLKVIFCHHFHMGFLILSWLLENMIPADQSIRQLWFFRRFSFVRYDHIHFNDYSRSGNANFSQMTTKYFQITPNGFTPL